VFKAVNGDSALIYYALSSLLRVRPEDEISHSLVPLTFLGRITPLTFGEPDS